MNRRGALKKLKDLGEVTIVDGCEERYKYEEELILYIIKNNEYKVIKDLVDMKMLESVLVRVLIRIQLKLTGQHRKECYRKIEDLLYYLALRGYIPYLDTSVYFKYIDKLPKLRGVEVLNVIANNIYRWVTDPEEEEDFVKRKLMFKIKVIDFVRMYHKVMYYFTYGGTHLREIKTLEFTWDKVKKKSLKLKMFGEYDEQVLDYLHQPSIFTYKKLVENVNSPYVYEEVDAISRVSIIDYNNIRRVVYERLESEEMSVLKSIVDKGIEKDYIFLKSANVDVLKETNRMSVLKMIVEI